MGVKGKNGRLQKPEVECFIDNFKPMKLVKKFFSCIFHFLVLVFSWISSMLSLLRLIVSTCWALVSTCMPKYYLSETLLCPSSLHYHGMLLGFACNSSDFQYLDFQDFWQPCQGYSYTPKVPRCDCFQPHVHGRGYCALLQGHCNLLTCACSQSHDQIIQIQGHSKWSGTIIVYSDLQCK